MNAGTCILTTLIVVCALWAPTAHGRSTDGDALMPRGTTPNCDAAARRSPAKASCSLDAWGRPRACFVQGNCRKQDGKTQYTDITVADEDVENLHNCNGQLQVGGC